MAGKTKPPPTAWEASDELWGRAEPALAAAYPPKPAGRPRVDFRPVLDGVIFRLRSGVQWSEPPERFGDDGGGHRWFQRWRGDGVPAKIRGTPVADRQEPGAAGRGRRAGSGGRPTAGWAKPGSGGEIGPDPTDRGENGTKQSVLVEADGGPLAAVIGPAGRNAPYLLEATLSAVVVRGRRRAAGADRRRPAAPPPRRGLRHAGRPRGGGLARAYAAHPAGG